MFINLLQIKLFFAFIITYANCDDIFGCGGFVKSSFSINFSRVEIKLYTKQGSLKYHTDCAPHNGYYLIPLYDKGDYILKIEPPSGWSFEPNSVPLHVDGTSDPCSLQQDINFNFKGFTLSGQVLSHGRTTGPPGIKLALKSGDQVINETTSSAEGHYMFPELFPGTYTIQGSHDTWIFDQSSVEIKIVDDNFKTTNRIVISGYDVSGSVFSDGQAIQGVNLLLFSKNSLGPVSGCNKEAVKGFGQKLGISYICHVTSSQDGKFVFPSLPPGDYKLVPFYKGEHIEFDVSPPEMDFTVDEGSLVLKENFQVQGFSVSGWIGTSAKGKSLADVSVHVNGEIHGISDANGIYHLENMRAGTYHLDVKKPNYVFEPIEMKINPNTPRLPDIYVSKYAICGQLKIDEYPEGLRRDNEKSLILRNEKNGNQVSVAVDASGAFCCDAEIGKYKLEPVVSDGEANSGLKFTPEKYSIEVIDKPVFNLNFQQFKAKVSGKVKCIESCEGIELELASTSLEWSTLKAVTGTSGTFEFEGCLPGSYVLSLIKYDWCFETKTIKVNVNDKDIQNLELHQTGFQVTIDLTHASAFKVKYPSGAEHKVELQKSKNMLCLPEKGIYDFTPSGCHLYKKSQYKFDTSSPAVLTLSPWKHLISGNILTEVNVSDINVIIKEPSSPESNNLLKDPVGTVNGLYHYEFTIFVKPDTDVQLKVTSQQLLFKPASTTIHVGDDCVKDAVEIVGKQGRFLKGGITPPLKGVSIKVFLKSNSEILTETTTNESGKFEVGPLDDDSEYDVTAETEGYVFTPLDKLGNFAAFKLAEIEVTVRSEDGEPLQGVLLSLSGSSDYRKNSVTQKNGRLSFIGLGPGQYFLRSMLKEYSFEPPSKMIDIKEGTQVKVNIRGKRVAFSLFGSVISLTGEAEVGVVVEAVSIPSDTCQQYQEEAASEQGGSLRIRGLHPGCEYVLRLKQGADINQHIERSAPKELKLMVLNGDITGVRLIVFRYYGQLDVSGNVVTNPEYLPSLKVRLYRDEAPDQIIHSISLSQSTFFYLPSMPIDHKTYILQLESSLSRKSYFLDQPSFTFTANTSFYHFTMNFKPRVRTVEQEVTQGSVLALPVAIVTLILVYNYSKILPLLTGLLLTLTSVASNSSKPQVVNESTTVDGAGLRKKLKPKRIQ